MVRQFGSSALRPYGNDSLPVTRHSLRVLLSLRPASDILPPLMGRVRSSSPRERDLPDRPDLRPLEATRLTSLAERIVDHRARVCVMGLPLVEALLETSFPVLGLDTVGRSPAWPSRPRRARPGRPWPTSTS